MDKHNGDLQLHDDQGVHSKIADIIIGEPVDEDGVQYQAISLTVPITRSIDIGSNVTVYDVANDKPVVTFMAESVLIKLEGEQFLKIDGRNYMAFLDNS